VESFFLRITPPCLAKEKNLLSNIHPSIYSVKNMIPFRNEEFDAVYSHMFFSMLFTWNDLKSMFQEIRRALISGGFNFFSVRNHNDKSYGKGRKIDNDDDVYELTWFQIRFFSEQQVKDLAEKNGFQILDIKEAYEEPVTLCLVSTRKRESLPTLTYSQKYTEYRYACYPMC
jgi:SAM-dependent methyltransferase